jgi:hypothetical protein
MPAVKTSKKKMASVLKNNCERVKSKEEESNNKVCFHEMR